MFPADARIIPTEEMTALPDVDIVVMATSGKAGLNPTLAAIRAGKTLALANKEVLVMAGEIITSEARKHGIELRPVDSEHSAIWQCLQGETEKPARLLLTASGGPFLKYSLAQMAEVTPERALKHPTWHMGPKVTIDSATLMNKGLETIEARWLFDFAMDDIKVVVHSQSIIHSMVEFIDGSFKAQLSVPDMRFPIQYALSYPERWSNHELPRLDWSKLSSLTFAAADYEKFPCLGLARDAGSKGGTYPAVLCAADEVAVQLFLEHRIGFLDIPRIVNAALESHDGTQHPTLDDILAADAWARDAALDLGKRGSLC